MDETTAATQSIFNEDTDYKRDLGIVESVSIVIGRIIGSGIFRVPGTIMMIVSCTSLFGLVWIIAGVVTIFHAICYSELVAMMPKSGGPYVYLKMAYNPLIAFLRGWAMFFVSETGAIAAVALVFAEYLNQICIIAFQVRLNHMYEIIIAIGIIWVLTAINLFGVFISGIFQNIFSAVKIIALGAIIGFSFTSVGSLTHFTTPFLPKQFSWNEFLAVCIALRFAFFAFSGWEGSTYIAEEVKNPRKNLPLSLLLGISGVILLYLGVNSAYLYQLPVKIMMQSNSIAADAMKAALGSTGGILISIAVLLTTFGNVSTQILCKARTWHAMARDNLFFDMMKPLHGKYKTPNNALIAQAVWASVILIALFLVYIIFKIDSMASYELVISFFTATGTIFNLLTIYSIFIFRKKYPDVPRPYKAWFYPWSIIIVMILLSIFLIMTLLSTLIPSSVGIVLVLSGLIYYKWKIKSQEKESH